MIKISDDTYITNQNGGEYLVGIYNPIDQNILDPSTPKELRVKVISYMSFP